MILRKMIVTWVTLAISALLYYSAHYEIPLLDQQSDTYFSSTLKTTTLAYATTRGINAVVSVLKESEIDVAPAGVGLTIAAGQILDPIDDMTERLSDVIVLAIISLGIQKIGFELGQAVTFKLVALLMLLFIPVIWLNLRKPSAVLRLVVGISYILLALRFLLPLSSLLNQYLYDELFQEQIAASTATLSVLSSDYKELSSLETEENKGFISSMTGGASRKIQQTKQIWSRVIDNAETIVTALLTLMTLYVGVFVMQVLLIPLSMLGLLLLLANYVGMSRLSDQLQITLNDYCQQRRVDNIA
jgi:hypothetical protein